MSKLLYIYERNCPTVSIMKNSEEQDRNCPEGHRFKKITEVTPADIDWCDVLQMIRPSDPYSVYLAKQAKKSGCFVMSMYDDDLYSPPKSYPMPSWRRKSVREALHTSNIVTTCSPHICAKYRNLTADKRAHVIDSVVFPNEIKLVSECIDAKLKDNVKLIYAANAGHIGFFNHFIMPIMPKLTERYAGKISMTFMGVRPELSQFESKIKIEYLNSMPLAEYRKKCRDGNYDIGLSPLISDEFTKCKYFNKFIEYSMAGIVGVYSNTEPYTYVVKHNENGILANDDPEDWYEKLCMIIDDALLRNRCIKEAQKLLLTRFSPDEVRKSEHEAIPELLEYHVQRTPCGSLLLQRILYWVIPWLDKFYQIFFYLCNSGPAGLWCKVRMHFREYKAYSK